MARYSAAKIIVRYHIGEPNEVTSDLAALAYRVGRIAVADGNFGQQLRGLAAASPVAASCEVSPGSARAGRHPRGTGATYKERCARDARGN